LLYYIRKLKEIHSILSINRLWRARLYEIGIIIKDFCLYFGLSGSLSRSIKIIIDARFTGHEFYEELNYSISYPSIGDCLDRYIPRFNEIIESSKGIYSIYLFSFPFLIINIITNDFPTTNQLNKFNNNINLGDLIAVLGPIDFVLGSVDLIHHSISFHYVPW
jgi:NADH:ubiquinone oxidoreductase subunit D